MNKILETVKSATSDEDFLEAFEGMLSNGRIMFLCVVGSKLHGTSNYESDTDISGIYLPSISNLLNLYDDKFFNQPDISDRQCNVRLYSFWKVINGALNCNPAMLELLYAPEQMSIHQTRHYSQLRRNAFLFLSSKAIYSYSSLATKLVKHYPEDFNSKSKVKHAVRLLMTGIELFKTGLVNPNVGKIDLQEKSEIEIFNSLSDLISEFMDAFSSSKKLPDRPDYAEIQKLYETIVAEDLRSQL